MLHEYCIILDFVILKMKRHNAKNLHAEKNNYNHLSYKYQVRHCIKFLSKRVHTHTDTQSSNVRVNNLSDIFSTISQLASSPPDILLSCCWARIRVALHPVLEIRDKERSRPVPPVQADKHGYRLGGLLAHHCPHQTSVTDKTLHPYKTFTWNRWK